MHNKIAAAKGLASNVKFRKNYIVPVVAIIGVLGTIMLIRSFAAVGGIIVFEGEAVTKTGNVTQGSDSAASGGSFLHFRAPGTNPPTPPPPPPPPSTGGNYDQNLALLRSAAGTRNDDFLQSPYRNTPSTQLPVNILTDPVGIHSGFSPDGIGGSFRTVCYFSHLAYDDPIVFPNSPGVSHLHMFFGNDEVNAFTTGDTLLNKGSSTCHGRELNRTGYWVPAVFDAGGNVRIPDRMFVYYKSFGAPSSQTQIYPKDGKSLRKVAGKGSAESAQDTTNVIQWTCGGRTNQPKYATIQSCGEGGLTGNVKFPQCWNGQTGWISDMSHLAISPGHYYAGGCPGSHPILLPSIEIFLEYDETPGGTDGWYTSSDVRQDGGRKSGGISIHADWWDGWNQEVNQAWVSQCTGNFHNCGLVSHIGDNRTLKGWESTSIDEVMTGVDYHGVKTINRQAVNKLCPGDIDSTAVDSAWCKSRLQAASPEVMAVHEEMGHVSGVHTGH